MQFDFTQYPSEEVKLKLLKTLTVLYVEDEEDIQQLLSRFLSRRVGTLHCASNGQEGLEKFLEERPDVVVTDIRMPEMSGLEMAREIRRVDSNIPIIITTAHDTTTYFMKSIDIGIDKYVLKPTDPDILLDALFNSTLTLFQKKELQKQHRELETLYGQIRSELSMASEVQRNTMRFISETPFLKGAMYFQPFSQVSGDIYDTNLNNEDGTINVFIGDATGHGVISAFMTMMVKMGLTAIKEDKSLDEVMYQLNNQLYSCFPPDKFVTGVFVKISPNGELRLKNAGHPPPVIFPGDGSAPVVFREKGTPLGMFRQENVENDETIYQLQEGDKLILYTDGLFECSDEKNEQFGVERFIEYLQENRSLSIDKLLVQVVAEAKRFIGEKPFNDDLTILGYHYLGDRKA